MVIVAISAALAMVLTLCIIMHLLLKSNKIGDSKAEFMDLSIEPIQIVDECEGPLNEMHLFHIWNKY